MDAERERDWRQKSWSEERAVRAKIPAWSAHLHTSDMSSVHAPYASSCDAAAATSARGVPTELAYATAGRALPPPPDAVARDATARGVVWAEAVVAVARGVVRPAAVGPEAVEASVSWSSASSLSSRSARSARRTASASSALSTAIRQSGNQAIRQSGNWAIGQSGNRAIGQSGNRAIGQRVRAARCQRRGARRGESAATCRTT
eukprot:5394475-Prymnesium_polylepis.1